MPAGVRGRSHVVHVRRAGRAADASPLDALVAPPAVPAHAFAGDGSVAEAVADLGFRVLPRAAERRTHASSHRFRLGPGAGVSASEASASVAAASSATAAAADGAGRPSACAR